MYDRYGFVTDSGDINASSSGAPVSAAAAATDGPGARRQRTKSRRHPPLIPNADGDFTPEQLAIMRLDHNAALHTFLTFLTSSAINPTLPPVLPKNKSPGGERPNG